MRHFLAAFVILLSVAVTTGLIFVYETTSYESNEVVERYNGSPKSDDFEIPLEYPKSTFEMLLNTHNHLFGFAVIFVCIGILFYFNSTISELTKGSMVEAFTPLIEGKSQVDAADFLTFPSCPS